MKVWHSRGRKCHLIHEVEVDGITLVTYKYWRASKQRWEYVSEPSYVLGKRKTK